MTVFVLHLFVENAICYFKEMKRHSRRLVFKLYCCEVRKLVTDKDMFYIKFKCKEHMTHYNKRFSLATKIVKKLIQTIPCLCILLNDESSFRKRS